MKSWKKVKDVFSRHARKGLIVLGPLTMTGSGFALYRHFAEDKPAAVVVPEGCFRINAPVAVGEEKQRQALNNLAQTGSVGWSLVANAYVSKVFFCAREKLPVGVGASYDGTNYTVLTAKNTGINTLTHYMAHELAHAEQNEYGLLSLHHWDFRSRIARTLSTEAAAKAVQYVTAFEAKLGGDRRYWDELLRDTTESRLLKTIEAVYTEKKAQGLTHEEALQAASFDAWHNIIPAGNWRFHYLNSALLEYAGYVVSLTPGASQDLTVNGFTQKQLHLAGKMGDRPSFTEGAVLPDVDSLLVKIPKMKWAFEALEIEHYRRLNKEEKAASLEAAAKKAGNPYLGLDYGDLLKQARTEAENGTLRWFYFYMEEADAKRPAPKPATTPGVS